MMIRLSLLLFLAITVGVTCCISNNTLPIATQSRYIKIDKQGTELHPWMGPYSCVIDSETALMWEFKSDDESIHDKHWSYSWYLNSVGEQNLGDCFFKQDRCDVSDLIEQTNIEQLCGYSDWRLPTSAELQTLINHHVIEGQTKIDQGFFPETFHSDYWSSDAQKPLRGFYRYLNQGATALNFHTGELSVLPYRNAAYVRLVRYAEQNHFVISH